MARAITNIEFIKRLKKASPKNRQLLLKNASDDEILSLCECSENVYKGNVPIRPRLVEQLRPYAKDIRRLIHRKGKIPHKRKLLIQKGGFLPAVLGAAIPVIISIVSEILRK